VLQILLLKEKAEPEALVAAAKGVAAATARLVFASRAKADPFSPAQQKLSAAAKAVASATQQLVEVTKNVMSDEEEAKPDWNSNENQSNINARKVEMEQQMKILKLQKELENAQKTLGNIRKAPYAESVQPPVKVNEVMASNQPAKRAQPTPQGQPQTQTPLKTAPNQPQPVKRTSSPSFSGIPPPIVAPAKTSPGGNTALPPSKSSGSGRQLPQVAKADSNRTYTLEELQNRPKDVDARILESYLSDQEFVQVFGQDKKAFALLPEWKRNAEKAKYRLL